MRPPQKTDPSSRLQTCNNGVTASLQVSRLSTTAGQSAYDTVWLLTPGYIVYRQCSGLHSSIDDECHHTLLDGDGLGSFRH